MEQIEKYIVVEKPDYDFYFITERRNFNNKVWGYNDGFTDRTLTLDKDVFELPETEQQKILSEFPGRLEITEGDQAWLGTDNFNFTSTNWKDDPWLATVLYK